MRLVRPVFSCGGVVQARRYGLHTRKVHLANILSVSSPPIEGRTMGGGLLCWDANP